MTRSRLTHMFAVYFSNVAPAVQKMNQNIRIQAAAAHFGSNFVSKQWQLGRREINEAQEFATFLQHWSGGREKISILQRSYVGQGKLGERL